MESLLDFQMDLSARLSKALVNFKKTPKDRISREYIETRLDSIEQLWLEFLTGHKDLMRTYSKGLKSSSYISEEVYDKTEEFYMDCKCLMKAALSKLDALSTPRSMSCNVKSSQVKLPKIDIPKFSGKYSEWCTFRDLFSSLVHTNSSLDDVEKLHYLKAYLTGEAEQLLRNIPIVSSNYEVCWTILEERYNNKRYICHQILSKLFGQRNIVIESAKCLKELLDTTNDCLHALSNIGIDTSSWDVMIIHILTLKLDPESRRQWEFSINNGSLDELPTYQQFKEFLTSRYRAIEFLEPESTSTKRIPHQSNSVNRVKALHVSHFTCPYCSEEHKLSFCKSFAKETVETRRKFVLDSNLCFNCLGNNHSAKNCYISTKCHICKRSHHSLLHPKGRIVPETTVVSEQGTSRQRAESSSKSSDDESGGITQVVTCFSTGKVCCDQVLLATALVKTTSRTGKSYMIRALLDQGSQSSFVTEATVQYLGLKKTRVQSHISGLGGDNNVTSDTMVTMEIKSRVDPKVKIPVKAYVLEYITSLLPARRLEATDWKELSEISLADPGYHTPNKVDMLLGAEVYSQILQDGLKKGPRGTLVAQSTSLGWILSGVVSTSTPSPLPDVKAMHCQVSDKENLLKGSWDFESGIKMAKKKHITDDKRASSERFVAETTRRGAEDRHVRPPFIKSEPEVSGSFTVAERRSKSVRNKKKKIKPLEKKYEAVSRDKFLRSFSGHCC